MSEKGKRMTFWEVIEHFEILVPKIQRDYVQGRDSKTIKKNREEFVKDLVFALSEDKPISLSFVYGTINEQKRIFIPVDGQQRLTTLFLLHAYLFASLKDNEGLNRLARKFSYDTRYTTNRFIRKLFDNSESWIKKNQDNKLSSEIRDSGWFNSSYEYDPNIVSMLTMFDLIDEHLRSKSDEEKRKYVNNLKTSSSECPISFMFLQLENLGSNHELYIRMNSRGKQLSDFEHFKAELYEKVELQPNFKAKIDGEWQDTFFNVGANSNEQETRRVDVLWKHLFHASFTIGAYTERAKTDDSEKYAMFKSRLLARIGGDEIVHFGADEYLDIIDKELIEAILEGQFSPLLDFLSWLKKEDSGFYDYISSHIFEPQSSETTDITLSQYEGTIFYQMLTIFAMNEEGTKEKANIDGLKSLYRVFLNLFDNSEINDPDNYEKARKAIWLLKNDINIDKWLEEPEVKTAFGRQVKEEIIKLKLIRENNDWEEPILKAEHTDFVNEKDGRGHFEGQIFFLLYMAGYRPDNAPDIEAFKCYSNEVSTIFNALDDDYELNILLRRALLTKGDYSIPKGSSIFSFFTSREKHHKFDWRGAFRIEINQDESLAVPIAVNCLQKVLDEMPKDVPFTLDVFKETANKLIKDFPEIGEEFPNDYQKRITDPKTSDDKLKAIHQLIKEKKWFEHCGKGRFYVGKWYDEQRKREVFYSMGKAVWKADSYEEIKLIESATIPEVNGENSR